MARPFVAAAAAASLSVSLAACASTSPGAAGPTPERAVPRELHLKCAGQMYSQRHGREAVNWAIYDRCVRLGSR